MIFILIQLYVMSCLNEYDISNQIGLHFSLLSVLNLYASYGHEQIIITEGILGEAKDR
jgi:hypothetical protein